MYTRFGLLPCPSYLPHRFCILIPTAVWTVLLRSACNCGFRPLRHYFCLPCLLTFCLQHSYHACLSAGEENHAFCPVPMPSCLPMLLFLQAKAPSEAAAEATSLPACFLPTHLTNTLLYTFTYPPSPAPFAASCRLCLPAEEDRPENNAPYLKEENTHHKFIKD